MVLLLRFGGELFYCRWCVIALRLEAPEFGGGLLEGKVLFLGLSFELRCLMSCPEHLLVELHLRARSRWDAAAVARRWQVASSTLSVWLSWAAV